MGNKTIEHGPSEREKKFEDKNLFVKKEDKEDTRSKE